ncbi:MAG TPA: DUF4998 domain-containing protein [Niastella sp.]
MKKIKILLMLFVWAVTIVSCSKWDDYTKYTADGETTYTGKLDSVKIYSGRLRVKMTGLLPADPKITRCKITWNNGKDSTEYSINKGIGIDSFTKIMNVPEGVNSFKIQTFDATGNGSMIVNAIGTAYGPKYESGLGNRPVARAELLTNGNAEVTWDLFDTTSGAKATVISYTTTSNTIAKVTVPLNQAITTLPNFKAGTSISLVTQYLPVSTAIDTFYCAAQSVGVMYDITSLYIVNAGINFANSDGGTDRWRTPANWTTTADVRNGGNDIGGLDAGSWLPSTALSLEAWWGMTAIPNGKIYQTFTLPAGKYTFIATAGDCSTGGTKYITVAAGSVLPDIGNVAASAIVYKSIDKNVDNKLNFTLTSATQVAVGLQAGMPAEGNYMKVFKVRLYGTP